MFVLAQKFVSTQAMCMPCHCRPVPLSLCGRRRRRTGALGMHGHCSTLALNEHRCRTGVLSPCGHRVGACACMFAIKWWSCACVVLAKHGLWARVVAQRLWVWACIVIAWRSCTHVIVGLCARIVAMWGHCAHILVVAYGLCGWAVAAQGAAKHWCGHANLLPGPEKA